MTPRLGAVLLLACLTCALPIHAADHDAAWKVLRGVTRDTNYTAFDRELKCAKGRIVQITAQSLIFEPDQGPKMTLARDRLLRVSDGTHPFDIVYTGRSSWFDVRALPTNDRESVRVVTKDRRKYQAKCKYVKASEDSITLSDSGKPRTIAKKDVAAVYYIRVKPLTEGADYALREQIIFHPEWWAYKLHLEGTITVQLYDASRPEENSPLPPECTPPAPTANHS